MSAEVSKSWFAVLNNPAERGYTGTPQEICEQLRDEWIRDSTTRSGAWAYCVSAAGLHHIHMVLEDKVAMRFSMVKKSYAEGMHFEATKGNKQQAEDYINKRHPYDEKGEQVLCVVHAGEIHGRQGKRNGHSGNCSGIRWTVSWDFPHCLCPCLPTVEFFSAGLRS